MSNFVDIIEMLNKGKYKYVEDNINLKKETSIYSYIHGFVFNENPIYVINYYDTIDDLEYDLDIIHCGGIYDFVIVFENENNISDKYGF